MMDLESIVPAAETPEVHIFGRVPPTTAMGTRPDQVTDCDAW
jgi:hypothetical protein